MVVIAGFALIAIIATVRRIVRFWTLPLAGLVVAAIVWATLRLDRLIADLIYPEGPRSLSGQAWSRLTSAHDEIHVLEMAGGQLWRMVLDTWGIAGIGMVATVAVIFRRGVRRELRLMALLVVLVTVGIVYTAPSALPLDQSSAWASGRYPDAMTVTFFIVGILVLLSARPSRLVACAAGSAAIAAGTAVLVVSYAGAHIHTAGFAAYNFADPVVLTQGWNELSVPEATGVALGLLAFWVLAAVAAGRLLRGPWAAWRVALLIPIAAMNLFALVQMTTHISQASTPPQQANSLGFVTAAGPAAGRQGRRGQRDVVRLAGLDSPVVRGVVDRAGLLLLRQLAGTAGHDGRRGALAVRPARPGELAEGAGRLACRGQGPSLQLGRLARSRPPLRHAAARGPGYPQPQPVCAT